MSSRTSRLGVADVAEQCSAHAIPLGVAGRCADPRVRSRTRSSLTVRQYAKPRGYDRTDVWVLQVRREPSRTSWPWSIRTARSTPPGPCWPAPTATSTPCAPSGWRRATRSPWCSPTASSRSRCTSPALQAGWYYVPINYRLSAPEIAYIVAGLRGEGHRVARALRRRDRRGRRRGRAARRRPGSRTAPSPGSSDVEAALAAPARHPSRRTARAGAAMHYTSGTTGRPRA